MPCVFTSAGFTAASSLPPRPLLRWWVPGLSETQIWDLRSAEAETQLVNMIQFSLNLEDKPSCTYLYHWVVVKFPLAAWQNRPAVDVDGPPSLVGDEEVPVIFQFDNSCRGKRTWWSLTQTQKQQLQTIIQYTAARSWSIGYKTVYYSTLFSRYFPRRPLQRQIYIYRFILGRPSQCYLYVQQR